MTSSLSEQETVSVALLAFIIVKVFYEPYECVCAPVKCVVGFCCLANKGHIHYTIKATDA